jgi:hypothetical protein
MTVEQQSGRADRALKELRQSLADQPPIDLERTSKAVRRRWVDDGVVVPTAALSAAWGMSRHALDRARKRGDLVGLKIANRQYYPAPFLGLAAKDVAQVCQALRAIDPVSQVIFWSRKHGALEGRTLAESIESGGVARVLHLAKGFADEELGRPNQFSRVPADLRR